MLLSLSPFLVLGGLLQTKVLQSGEAAQNAAFSAANNLALEVVAGFNTVSSFVWEDTAVSKFTVHVETAVPARKRAAHLTAIAWGMSFFFLFAVYALGFWYGAVLVARGIPAGNFTILPGGTLPPPCCGGISYSSFLIVFMSVMMGAMGLGQMLSVTPDFAAARTAGVSCIPSPPPATIRRLTSPTPQLPFPSLQDTP